MCGIAGYYSYTDPPTGHVVAAVERATRAQMHRGPDGVGFFKDGRVALGHQRLSILDLSVSGHQPMSNEDATVWITYNGEIYNYLELRRELLRNGHTFRSGCDTEVLVHGYEQWGIAGLLERLRGMFAFALYDSARAELIVARDRLGIKPLYYTQGPEERWFAFASETKALAASGLVSSELDRRALAGFLLFGSIPAPWTILKHVKCLEPGHFLVQSPRGCSRPQRYWDFAEATARERDRQAREPVPSLAETLQDAVTRHLVSDAPLGVFLSGGMDSAAVVALAGRSQPLTTLTIGFEEDAYNEAAQARAAAESFGTNHHEVRVTAADFLNDLPAFLAAMDQPTNDGVNTYCISKAARQVGLKVVLSGLGGDEVFWGYRHYKWLEGRMPWFGMLLDLPTGFRGPVLTASSLYGRALGREKWQRIEYLRGEPTVTGLYFTARGFFPEAQVSRLAGFSPSELKDLVEEVLKPDRSAGTGAGSDGAAFNCLEVKHYLHDQLLRDADVFSMAHSVETRVPLLDHELVCRAAALPAATKVPNGLNKPALLGAAPHPIVAAAAARAKKGFTFPIGRWLQGNFDQMRQMALESDQLDRRETNRLFEAFGAGRLHWSRAWALVVLGSTLRQSQL